MTLAVVKRFLSHLNRMRWWERAASALYLAFSVQEVVRGNLGAALIAVSISALLLLVPFAVFKRLPLAEQLAVAALGGGLIFTFVTLGRIH